MKINLHVGFHSNSLRIIANFWLKAENPKISSPMQAIIDTGSPNTILSRSDLLKMRISPIQLKKLEGKREDCKLGGGNIRIVPLENVKMLFYGEDSKELIIPKIFVTLEDNNKIPHPSLIGIDFLLMNKFKLVFDPTNKIAYLESI